MVFHLTFLLFATGLIIASAFSDFLKLRIPNIFSVAIALSFFPAYFAADMGGNDIFQPLNAHLKAGGIIFVAMLILFFLKTMGGGDAKLLPAIALWTGTAGLPNFLFWTIMAGFPLALIAVFFRSTNPGQKLALKISNYELFSNGWIKALANKKNIVPYGIAIALGGIGSFRFLGYLP